MVQWDVISKICFMFYVLVYPATHLDQKIGEGKIAAQIMESKVIARGEEASFPSTGTVSINNQVPFLNKSRQ